MASSSFLFLIHLFCGMFMLRSRLMEAQSNHNISLGSTLSPLGPQKSWQSPSGDFSFGFLRIRDDERFLLAIWFDKTDPKTVVWSATNLSATREMALKVTADAQLVLTHAQLVLTDGQNSVLWNTTGDSDDVVSHAAMLDDGNFVLARPDGSLRWQSFEYPTDTLLPGQSLLPGNKLQSMDTGYLHRRFELHLRVEANGSDLSLYAITTPSGSSYGFYWSVSTSNIATQLCFQQSRLVLVLMNESVINITSPSPETETDDKVYQRATLGDDGVFRHYVHPKNNATMGWKTVAYVPKEICQSVFTYGSWICGFNSYCKRDNENIECKCPPQYSYLDHNRKFGGCKQDFSSQSCDVDESSMFELQAMVNVDWPLSDYDHFQPMKEEDCKEACLTDCLCAAVIFENSTGDCWKKRHPMSNGRSGSFVNRTAYIKIPKPKGDLARVATSWGYIMPQILIPNAN
ncbi:G-type lectin S-receptor-like serine/threonine-protein kinase LECRK1 [Curcuma longa]|uniref:G-type lectin S-receptor-like serine/threonine-protein kinase LECRK1 n=1 Tax=Curcuma longa TaxID=136217 RepID=UPI003D9E65C3